MTLVDINSTSLLMVRFEPSGTGLGRAACHCYSVVKVVIGCIPFLSVGGNGGRGRHYKRKNQASVPQLFPATWTSPSPSVTNFTPRTSGSSSRSRVTIEDSGSTLSWPFLQSTDCSFFVTVVHLSRVCRLEMLCQL